MKFLTRHIPLAILILISAIVVLPHGAPAATTYDDYGHFDEYNNWVYDGTTPRSVSDDEAALAAEQSYNQPGNDFNTPERDAYGRIIHLTCNNGINHVIQYDSPPPGCNSPSNSCGDYNPGYIIAGSCNAGGAPAERPYWNQSCSASNACGTNSGSTDCNGNCNVSAPSVPGNLGQACTSAENACGQTQANGSYQCNGSCSSTPPANPSNLGQACTSSANACAQTQANGTWQCNGSCSSTPPANPGNLGQACTSAGNSCGQTQANGTWQCNGSCSSTPPPDSGCNQPPGAPVLWGVYDNSTATYYGSSAPEYHAAGYAEYANATDPNGDNVDYLFYFYNNQTGQYITVAWSGWVGSGQWGYVNSLVNLPAGTYQVGAYAMDTSGLYSPFSGWATITLVATSCTSAPNSCGQTNGGTIQANGSCSAVTPPNPAGYGNACTSAANSCGQTSAGTVQCNGSCNASAPPSSNCPPTASLSASPSTILSGQSSNLTWSSTNATSCTAAGGFSTAGAANNATGVSVSPSGTSNYQISCAGPSGSVNSNVVTVTVQQPTAYITAAPNRVLTGTPTNVSWSAANVISCVVTGTDGYNSGTLSGPTIATTTVARTITTQTTYRISCGGASVVSTILVNVVPSLQEF